MLPRSHRLTRPRDFAKARRHGSNWSTPLVAIFALSVPDEGIRVGVSVSKRVGTATVRNRVKRLLREAIHQRLATLHPGLNLVFVARPAASQASFAQVSQSVDLLLQKTNTSKRWG